MSASVPVSPSPLKSAEPQVGQQLPARQAKKASMSASVAVSPSRLKSAVLRESVAEMLVTLPQLLVIRHRKRLATPASARVIESVLLPELMVAAPLPAMGPSSKSVQTSLPTGAVSTCQRHMRGLPPVSRTEKDAEPAEHVTAESGC